MSVSLAPAYAPTPIPVSPQRPTSTIPQTNYQETSTSTNLDTGFEIPGKVGENMDDLLSWLFNSNSNSNTTGGDWAQDSGGHQYLPTFLEPTPQPIEERELVSISTDENPAYYHYNPQTSQRQDQAQAREQTTVPTFSGAQNSSQTNTDSIQTGQHKRYPQPVHPLYVPNIPGKTNIPTFTGSANGGRERERYKEVIDENVKASMMDMFEVSPPPSCFLIHVHARLRVE
jgi:hypothetical protein